MIARRTPRRSRLRRALLPLILGFSLSAASNSADALTCGEEFYENGGPLDANEIEVPLDAQPWFFVNCGIADTLNCELRDNSDPSLLLANELSINGCELAEPIVSDSGTTYPQGVAHLAPTELLTAGHAYNVSCGGNNGPSGTFVVRNNNTPSMAPLTLDNVVPRREIEEGCCGQRHLSIKRDYSGGTLSEFLAEGGIVEIQYADGHFITDDDTERDEFPDLERSNH